MKPTTDVTDVDDAVWSALNDASRRRMLDLLRQRPMTTGEVAAQFSFSRFAVMKHLNALEKAGLIIFERRGGNVSTISMPHRSSKSTGAGFGRLTKCRRIACSR